MIAAVELGTVLSLFGILFGGLLGLYGFVYKIMQNTNLKLAEIYDTVNAHVQDSVSHLDSKSPAVSQAVCEQVQKTNELHFATLAEGQKEIKTDLSKLVDKLL